MKKRIYILMLLIGLTSCGEDIVFNNDAAFQGVKNNESWRAADASATVSDEASLLIQAVTINETVTLEIPLPTSLVSQKDSSTYITHNLGTSDTKTASYTTLLNGALLTYETGVNIGDGQIIITDYDGVTISGKFRFNAENIESESSESPTVNFQYGVFYKVPIAP
jgi:hypothetical protein